MKRNSFCSAEEIKEIGFGSIGDNVFISRKASFYDSHKMSIGDNVRIDDFCILSGCVTIGNYVHIAAYSALFGGDKGVTIKDFANISSKVSIYSVSDDYSGETMTNPMVEDKYKCVQSEAVLIEKHVIIGAGCVVFPGVVLREGSSFGAMTLINKSSDPWSINVGIPFRKIKERKKELLLLERNMVGPLAFTEC
ncbi:MAG: acyltransferase [Kiritimatiellae bacterium]|nr:acyltransferase [Kiritimatiellia bacterium]